MLWGNLICDGLQVVTMRRGGTLYATRRIGFPAPAAARGKGEHTA